MRGKRPGHLRENSIPGKNHSNETVQKHGSIPYNDLRSMGISPENITDFSATVNPFPLPLNIQRAVSLNHLSSYPDADNHDALLSIASFYDIPSNWIAVSAGMTEVLYLLPLLYRKALQFCPTYGDYSDAFKLHRRTLESIRFPKTDTNFDHTLDALRKRSFRIVLVCNPNNPTGEYITPDQTGEICRKFPHVIVCIDESYQELGEECESSISLTKKYKNLLIIKSLTKPFGIGGLRIGYAVSSGNIINKIRKYLLPWGINIIAQRIVPLLFAYISEFKINWHSIMVEKNKIVKALSKAGYDISPGRCPFLLVRVNHAPTARRFLLKKHHLAVRDCSSFGFTDMLRIMPSIPDNNRILLNAMCREKYKLLRWT